MSDHYTVNLAGGKYTVINRFGQPLEFLRHGEAWPAADSLRFVGVVLAMAHRIEELEVAIKSVLDGPVDARGARSHGEGLTSFSRVYSCAGDLWPTWEKRLRNALEQKP